MSNAGRSILAYFLIILGIAVAYLVWRGADGVTARNVAIAVPAALIFAALVWLRWDVAPKIAKERRTRKQDSGENRG